MTVWEPWRATDLEQQIAHCEFLERVEQRAKTIAPKWWRAVSVDRALKAQLDISAFDLAIMANEARQNPAYIPGHTVADMVARKLPEMRHPLFSPAKARSGKVDDDLILDAVARYTKERHQPNDQEIYNLFMPKIEEQLPDDMEITLPCVTEDIESCGRFAGHIIFNGSDAPETGVKPVLKQVPFRVSDELAPASELAKLEAAVHLAQNTPDALAGDYAENGFFLATLQYAPGKRPDVLVERVDGEYFRAAKQAVELKKAMMAFIETVGHSSVYIAPDGTIAEGVNPAYNFKQDDKRVSLSLTALPQDVLEAVSQYIVAKAEKDVADSKVKSLEKIVRQYASEALATHEADVIEIGPIKVSKVASKRFDTKSAKQKLTELGIDIGQFETITLSERMVVDKKAPQYKMAVEQNKDDTSFSM
ncbi:MAG: hypothetical protein D6712_19985 [Chloroflexi bacterium]|nr:MAG: hypothetical protein D6712_19985 [Chloroflexota bacterium]